MTHKHSLYDTDKHFSINPKTRVITNLSGDSWTLMQYDHNSERITFELPRYIDKHDMTQCNEVEVHYINIGKNGERNSDVYKITDLNISQDSTDIVTCSWLISGNATLYVGTLSFSVRFACVSDGETEYAWNTAVYNNIAVGTTINNAEAIVEEYSDILAQWRKELTALTSGVYITVRKEFENAANLKTADIYALYDELPAVKNPIKDNNGNTVLYEYVFSTGDYNTAGVRGELDAFIKKPTVLITAGIHGFEKNTVFSTYRFFADLVENDNVPDRLKESVIFKVIPVALPYGFDINKSINANGVNIGRNFDYKWTEENYGYLTYSGPSAESEKETQAIVNWLKANQNATLFIDFHGSGNYDEVAMVIGLNEVESVKNMKKVALRGLDRIIPYWRKVIGYSPDSIFSYSSDKDLPGRSTYYAASKLGIPSFGLECATQQNGATEKLAAETIAAGAEALGNILLEVYESTKTVKSSEQLPDHSASDEGKFLRVVDGQVVWATVPNAEEVAY